MNSDHFFIYCAFIGQDKAMLDCQKKIDTLSIKKTSLIDALKHEEEILFDMRRVAHDAKKNLDAHELDIKTARERQRVVKRNLDSSSSSKEYFSLESELLSLVARIDAQEDILFQLFDTYESLEQKRAEKDLYVQVLRDETEKNINLIEQEKALIEKEYNEHGALYEKLKSQVNREMLETFLAMKKMVSDPVVPVNGTLCSACFNTISMQDLVSVRKHKLVPCQNCFRLLYAAPVS